MKLEFSRQIFEKYPHIKFHKNLSSVSAFVPCGRTDLTKLTVAFRDFADAPKNFCLDDFIKIISPQADVS